jgi:hypothetical protein
MLARRSADAYLQFSAKRSNVPAKRTERHVRPSLESRDGSLLNAEPFR